MQYNEISLTKFHACIFIIAEPGFSGLFLAGGILIPCWGPAHGSKNNPDVQQILIVQLSRPCAADHPLFLL
jgi:hypothetical protein